jgi:hypothetical protein
MQHEHSRVGLVVWSLIAVLGLLVGLRRATEHFQAPPEAAKPLPTLVEASRPILYRVYFDTPTGSYHFLISDQGELCLTDRETYLATFVGQPKECLWQPIGGTPNIGPPPEGASVR